MDWGNAMPRIPHPANWYLHQAQRLGPVFLGFPFRFAAFGFALATQLELALGTHLISSRLRRAFWPWICTESSISVGRNFVPRLWSGCHLDSGRNIVIKMLPNMLWQIGVLQWNVTEPTRAAPKSAREEVVRHQSQFVWAGVSRSQCYKRRRRSKRSKRRPKRPCPGSKPRCQRTGPITNNAYLNYLRYYRRTHPEFWSNKQHENGVACLKVD